jgi:drug/metabolite transporter (DMT)-like permease
MNGATLVGPTGFPDGKVAALTLTALFSFALNSLLCRAALGRGQIDAASFTLVRLAAGALVLGLLARNASTSGSPHETVITLKDRALSALALFAYALPFSLAYLRIPAGTGAFVLFGCVQVTMIGSDLLAGRRVGPREVLGLAAALFGLAWLTRPGFESPDPVGVLLMAVAGFAWGIYSVRGRKSGPPLQATARNFTAAIPMALIVMLFSLGDAHATPIGLALALTSGGITSGLGYVAWYGALPAITATRASIVQLAVPPLASALGVLLLGEVLTPRLLFAAPMILGGIAIAISRPRPN